MENSIDKIALLELAKRIKDLRKDKNLTQAECYNDTGINFGRIERGVRDISFTTLLKLCKYFEIPVKDFFNEDFK
ncbi:MAG: helix-turn-helix transcriptional regulator [Flavobacteriaceae bacterium]|nr:helix-turn-helix transcriptional regulator [Flavobacteriaceae bacterium]